MNTPLRLMVTTWNSICVLDVQGDLTAGATSTIHSGEGVYFGVTWSTEALFVLARRYGQDKRNTLLVFDKNLRQVDRIDLPTSIREAHQIQWHDSKIYIANTSRNTIAIFNLLTGETSEIEPIPSRVGENFNHINSLRIEGGALRFVAANRFRNSFFASVDLTNNQIMDIDAVGLSAHNIIPTPYGDFTCDSYHGALVLFRGGDWGTKQERMTTLYLLPDIPDILPLVIDMPRANFREKRGGPTFPRGLAVTQDIVFAGLSDVSKRDLRHQSPSRLIAFSGLGELADGRPSPNVKALNLGDHGAVMDVRILNAPEMGHPVAPFL